MVFEMCAAVLSRVVVFMLCFERNAFVLSVFYYIEWYKVVVKTLYIVHCITNKIDSTDKSKAESSEEKKNNI